MASRAPTSVEALAAIETIGENKASHAEEVIDIIQRYLQQQHIDTSNAPHNNITEPINLHQYAYSPAHTPYKRIKHTQTSMQVSNGHAANQTIDLTLHHQAPTSIAPARCPVNAGNDVAEQQESDIQ